MSKPSGFQYILEEEVEVSQQLKEVCQELRNLQHLLDWHRSHCPLNFIDQVEQDWTNRHYARYQHLMKLRFDLKLRLYELTDKLC